MFGQFAQEKHIANRGQNRTKGQQYPKCTYGGIQKGRKQHDENTCEGHKYAKHVEPREILFEIKHGEKCCGNGNGGHNDGNHRCVTTGKTIGLADEIKKWLKTAESKNRGDILALYLHVFAEKQKTDQQKQKAGNQQAGENDGDGFRYIEQLFRKNEGTAP